MKREFSSRSVLLLAGAALILTGGCGKKEDAETTAPKGQAQRSDVQSASLGSGAGQQPMSGTKKPQFDNTK